MATRRDAASPRAEGCRHEDHDGLATPDVTGWFREMPFWAISALLHVVILVILLNIALQVPAAGTRSVEFRVVPQPPAPTVPSRPRNVTRRLTPPNRAAVTRPDMPTTIEMVTPAIQQGTALDDSSSLEKFLMPAEDAIGITGRRPGSFGQRQQRVMLIGAKGDAGTADAVRAALEWLRRHQSPDGGWRAHDFVDECATTCANENATRHDNGGGLAAHDIGVTGLAILAFTGYGHTHQDGVFPEYVQVLRKAVKFLKSSQVRSSNPSENGRFGSSEHEQWTYDHAIATMAMGELLAMSNDIIGLKKSVTRAVKLCLHAQNSGHGWKYGIKPGNNDTSVTGWMVLALKTARNARIDIPREDYNRAFSGALRWFDRATSEATGKTGYEVPGDEGSRLAGETDNEKPYTYSKDLSCMTAVAVLCRLFAGESRSTPIIKRGVDILMRETPRWVEQNDRQLSRINVYYWYYGSYAMFQFGGSLWKKWNVDMQKALLATQRQGYIDEDGSWDPIGEWGLAGGRVYSTALGAMTLEVYYRFERTKIRPGVGAKKRRPK